ncbi:MAG: nitroreductase family deazaflavin-dependent oxidoreductase [Chloroflexi bacterium]|nr:MAG: nitroreductase family deazaflavin-dependent oxidoreductase [Chloroflexota bacterium]
MRSVYRSRIYRSWVPPLLRFFGPLHVRLYRALGGRLVGHLAQGGMPVLLLTTIGRSTRRERTRPIGFVPDGESWLVVGSNGALPRDPGWISNIRAHPSVFVELGRGRLAAHAAILQGPERERAWRTVASRYRFFETYQSAVRRELPLVRLRANPVS